MSPSGNRAIILTKQDAEDLVNRISEHISLTRASNEARHLWFGYACALLEWGLLEPKDFSLIVDMCEPIDSELSNQVLLGT